jgi:arylsulfatase A-like enzyme
MKLKKRLPVRLLLLLLLLTQVFHSKANEIEIQYYVQGVEKVFLTWGINDWKFYEGAPKGTFKVRKTMRTPMVKTGDHYTVKIEIPAGNTISYGFIASKHVGPFGIETRYWDLNKGADNKFYHVYTNSSQVVKIKSAIDFDAPEGSISFSRYSKLILFSFLGLAGLIFVLRKFYYKSAPRPFDQAAFFVALSISLAAGLIFTRLYSAGLLFPFLLKPISTLPDFFSASWSDMKFAALLTIIFGGLFFVFKKGRKFILGLFALLVLLAFIAALLNIKVTEMLGRPFNYQWLYYSDFLKSIDASKAIGANISSSYLYGCGMLLMGYVIIGWLGFMLYQKWPRVAWLVLPVIFAAAFISALSNPLPAAKTANPITYFIASVFEVDEMTSTDAGAASSSEFDIKHSDSLSAAYANQLKKGAIKNMIVLVLESTPAEYIGVYKNTIKATPFMDSMQRHSLVFENIYAHTPATNKSMISILCSQYPNLSFKSITREYPDMDMPSLTSELKKHQYRSLFLNSGDNRFQNAEGFLQHRGFNEVLDFRTNQCSAVFADKRYSNKNYDGVDDSCLSVRFFDWYQKDTQTPFFAMLWTFQTHYPYFNAGTTVDFNTGNPSLDKYLNALRRADETLQQLVDGLKKRGLLESTLIVVTGDHGEAFGRHNQTTHASNIYEENLHVPLLFINPVLFSGERVNTVGGISDIAPSIFSVLGKPAPEQWQGESLFSVNRRKAVYFFSPYSDFLFGLREDKYKLIFNASDNSFKLFDLEKDPYETTDIQEQHPAFVQEANKKLRAWMKYQNNYMAKKMGDKKNGKTTNEKSLTNEE